MTWSIFSRTILLCASLFAISVIGGCPSDVPNDRDEDGKGGNSGQGAGGGAGLGGPTSMDIGLEVRNDDDIPRFGEVAFSGVPISKEMALTSTDNLVIIDEEGEQVTAQFRPLARWGGVVDDPRLPIRWLEVAMNDRRWDRMTTSHYRLKALAEPPPVRDKPLTVSERSGLYIVDTGSANILADGAGVSVPGGAGPVFTINPQNPALIERITLGVGGEELYVHQPGAGPRLSLNGGNLVLSTANPGQVVLDPNGFEVIDRGPVKATFVVRGHFVDPNGATRCDQLLPNGPSYEAMGFTAAFTFSLGQPYIDMQMQFRNECSDLFNPGAPWPGSKQVDQVSWEWPMTNQGPSTTYYAGAGDVATATEDVIVEQQKGTGNPWKRQARVLVGGNEVESAESFDAPLVGVASGNIVATAQLAWMRYREPQALAASSQGLSVRIVSSPLTIGAAKGLWNFARVNFISRVSNASNVEGIRQLTAAALERGLLVRASRQDTNAARVFPSLGTDADSPIKQAYVGIMERFHERTVGATGQWARHKTYGSQLWPDIQVNSYPSDVNVIGPTDNGGGLNYWNSSRAELYEFFRSGDPKWAWDYALPQTWLQLFTAYGNIGDYDHGNRNGFALNSAVCGQNGCEEGQWHRYALGSDDYTYTVGNLGYVVRPNNALLRRFSAAGKTVLDRYSIPRSQQGQRETYVNAIDLTRQVVQHLAQLANCAEFVPGERGQSCHTRLIEIVTELAEENMATGLMCQGDIQPPNPSLCSPPNGDPNADWCDCVTPQQFMINSLIFPFLLRMYLNYGDVGGKLREGLVMSSFHYYRQGLGIAPAEAPSMIDDEQRPSIPIQNNWLGQPGWDTDAMPFTVVDVDVTDGNPATQDPSGAEANLLLPPNKPQTVAVFLAAHGIEPKVKLCGVSKQALDQAALPMLWNDYDIDAGWFKGAAQVMQSMIFGVGVYDACTSAP